VEREEEGRGRTINSFNEDKESFGATRNLGSISHNIVDNDVVAVDSEADSRKAVLSTFAMTHYSLY
jgi:hypothetical protein